ncbi:TPA: ABC transporter permease [Streptococcus agalactiae]|nr:ABC transporter permease [Streptococcus agalactiae]
MYLSSSIIKKILSAFLALFFISLLTFILIKLSTVNPAENYLRLSKISVSPEALKEAEHYLGLDKPLWKQYWLWFQKALTGDFGYSYVLRLPVLDLVLQRFLATLFLGTSAFLLIVTISTPLGVWAGLHESSRSDYLIRFLSFSSVSMPSITLSFSTVGQYIALIRKAISQENRSLNVENARLRGVKERYIVTHHLLRNALPAIMTALSLTWVYLLTGSIIVEEIFSWNGIGRLFVTSLRTSDLPVIQACMLIFGTLFLANNFMTQCLMNWVDPRLRKSREK